MMDLPVSYTDEDVELVAALLAGFEVRTDEEAVEASHPGDARVVLDALDKAGRLLQLGAETRTERKGQFERQISVWPDESYFVGPWIKAVTDGG